ncbi:MAG: hypothetical protein AAF664_00630 [Planctomycetota bacterium]
MKFSSVIQTSLIIRAALIMGTTTIGGVMLFMAMQNDQEAEIDLLFGGIGGGLFVATAVASFVVPGVMSSQASQIIDEEVARKLRHGEELEVIPATMQDSVTIWQTGKMIQGVVLEGGAVVNIVLSFIGHNAINLIFALAAVVLMAITSPSASGLRSFLERNCMARK